MGWGAEESWEEDCLEARYEDENYTVWHGQDGSSYSVPEMKNSHIRNCIRCIATGRFNAEWIRRYGDDWLEVFEEELSKRHRIREAMELSNGTV